MLFAPTFEWLKAKLLNLGLIQKTLEKLKIWVKLLEFAPNLSFFWNFLTICFEMSSCERVSKRQRSQPRRRLKTPEIFFLKNGNTWEISRTFFFQLRNHSFNNISKRLRHQNKVASCCRFFIGNILYFSCNRYTYLAHYYLPFTSEMTQNFTASKISPKNKLFHFKKIEACIYASN